VTIAALGPRHDALAARFAAGLCFAAGLVIAATSIFEPAARGGVVLTVGTPALILAMGVSLLLTSGAPRAAMCFVTPVAGCVPLMLLGLQAGDGSAAAQILFVVAVLYGASQLRTWGAVAVTAVAIGCDAGLAFGVLDAAQATRDALFVGVANIATTVLFVHAGNRQAELVAELERLAAIDPLTGLVTRRVLDDATRSALAGAAGQQGTALVLIDVDKFKTINDTHGHPAGDRALTHISDLLAAHARPDDVVARMGGDELAVLMPGCPEDVAARRAQEMVDAVRVTPLVLDDGTVVPLSISAGVAHAPGHEAEIASLYASADAGLYLAKDGGRGRVCIDA
jgi:diguanylate cyclase (GGDEF)-like protein